MHTLINLYHFKFNYMLPIILNFFNCIDDFYICKYFNVNKSENLLKSLSLFSLLLLLLFLLYGSKMYSKKY